MANNNDLHKAARNKKDEFYTTYDDIQLEINHYEKQFKDKTVLRNCDEYQPLNAVTHYSKKRIDVSLVNENTYVGVENLLQNKQGKTTATSVPKAGTVIAFEKGDILIGNIRPYLRKIWLSDCNGGTNGDVLTIQIDNRKILMPEFLYYVLSSEQFFLYDIQNSKGAKMPRGNKDAVMNYTIPIPPLAEQERIVTALDKFNKFTALIIEALEKETKLRQKQYEYYRDKLLTFKAVNKR